VGGGGGETPARTCGYCGDRRHEAMAPSTSTRPGEAPEVLLDGGEVAAGQIEGGGGARVTGGVARSSGDG
jgi:hypothetical protein